MSDKWSLKALKDTGETLLGMPIVIDENFDPNVPDIRFGPPLIYTVEKRRELQDCKDCEFHNIQPDGAFIPTSHCTKEGMFSRYTKCVASKAMEAYLKNKED